MVEKSSNIISEPISPEWLYSHDPKKQLMCLISIRKKLSQKDPDIEGMLYTTSRVLELMMSRKDSEALRECAWILTNIASGKSQSLGYVKYILMRSIGYFDYNYKFISFQDTRME